MRDIEETIEALKLRMKAVTDSDLARKLAIDKRTVSAWRARGAVPERYLSITAGADHQTVNTPPLRWALMRITLSGWPSSASQGLGQVLLNPTTTR